MRLIRKTLALLTWFLIYLPTTLFVVLVMIKAYFGNRQEKKEAQKRTWA